MFLSLSYTPTLGFLLRDLFKFLQSELNLEHFKPSTQGQCFPDKLTVHHALSLFQDLRITEERPPDSNGMQGGPPVQMVTLRAAHRLLLSTIRGIPGS